MLVFIALFWGVDLAALGWVAFEGAEFMCMIGSPYTTCASPTPTIMVIEFH
jgi:hypothetical protein